MKNKKIWPGMLVIILVFGMTVVSCNDSDDNSGPTGGDAGIPGTTDGSLSISNQQVWTANYDSIDVSWAHFKESRKEITAWNFGGDGAITNGQLNFNLTSSEAQDASLWPLKDCLDWVLEGGGTISVEDVQYGSLYLAGGDFSLARNYGRAEEIPNGYNFTNEWVDFLYVDRAVVITHPDGPFKGDKNNKIRAFKIELQKGWNALHWHETGTVIETESEVDYDITTTLNAGNPARLRWVIFEWGG